MRVALLLVIGVDPRERIGRRTLTGFCCLLGEGHGRRNEGQREQTGPDGSPDERADCGPCHGVASWFAFHRAWCSRRMSRISGPAGSRSGSRSPRGWPGGLRAQHRLPGPFDQLGHIAPARMSGVSYSFRTWRSCQIIIVSSTVPIPPGTTT